MGSLLLFTTCYVNVCDWIAKSTELWLKCHTQACRVVRYGTVTVCTVRTVLVNLRRTTVIVTPYFTVITVKYGTVYGKVPSWHCQCKNGLRMASSPQNLPFSLPGVLLPCANATQCFHERP
jgi:hypothetical protein